MTDSFVTDIKFQGFGKRDNDEKKMNPLEEQMQVSFVDKEHELFPGEIGKMCTVYLTWGLMYGVYRGMNKRGWGIMLPHIVFERDNPLDINEKKVHYNSRWETIDIKYFPVGEVRGMDPLGEEFAKRIVPGEKIPEIKQYTQESNQ